MAAQQTVKIICPACGSKYRVPSKAVGHRARCTQCKNVWRVTDPLADSHRSPSGSEKNSVSKSSPPAVRTTNGGRLPTEEDIMRWLAEADDEIDPPAVRPHVHETTPTAMPSRHEPVITI